MTESQSPDWDLIDAAGCGDTHGISQALKAGADPLRARDQDGATALMLAAHSRNHLAVGKLLPLSDPSAVDVEGWTAFFAAVDAESPACASMLAPISDMDHLDKQGRDALQILDRHGERDIRWGWFLQAMRASRESRALRAATPKPPAATHKTL